MNSDRVIDVLVVAESGLATALAAALERRGHRVVTAGSAADARARRKPEVLVAEMQLDDSSGLEVMSAFERAGPRPHTILLAADPTFEACRSALRRGVFDVLAKPCSLAALCHAVEAAPTPIRNRAHDQDILERTFGSRRQDLERATREVVAFALVAGLGPSGRARVGSAVSEVLDNARRHAYGTHAGVVHVRAEMIARQFVVTLRDEGSGFEPAREDAGDDTLESGLARARSLAESVSVTSTPGLGTCVRLGFAAWRVNFDGDAEIDLSEHDWFGPSLARHVLLSLKNHRTADRFHLTPALAVVVGRLLDGPDPRVEAGRAPWR